MASNATPGLLPEHSTALVEQAHRKLRLAAAFRLFGRFGFDEGLAGHITVRDPMDPETFWVNPLGRNFKMMRVSDLIRLDHSGEVVEGAGLVNRAAFVIHSAVHRARPDVHAAAHSHSLHGQAFSSLGTPLQPLTQDACAFFEDHDVFHRYSGVVNDPGEGKHLAAALGQHKALILQNHGLLTVGATVDEAAWWFITLERSCQAELLARAAGDPIRIGDEVARATAAEVGTPLAGWFSFQPLFEWILESEPELAT